MAVRKFKTVEHSMRQGEHNAHAKLSESAVKYILDSVGHKSGSELARELGVTRQLVSAIRKGKAWSHVQ